MKKDRVTVMYNAGMGTVGYEGIPAYFDSGEVQQLRAIIKQNISEYEMIADSARRTARYYKTKDVSQEIIDEEWKAYHKIRAKIKKLAKLQMKMKAIEVLA